MGPPGYQSTLTQLWPKTSQVICRNLDDTTTVYTQTRPITSTMNHKKYRNGMALTLRRHQQSERRVHKYTEFLVVWASLASLLGIGTVHRYNLGIDKPSRARSWAFKREVFVTNASIQGEDKQRRPWNPRINNVGPCTGLGVNHVLAEARARGLVIQRIYDSHPKAASTTAVTFTYSHSTSKVQYVFVPWHRDPYQASARLRRYLRATPAKPVRQ
jgi:hypothetical protein